MSVSVIDCWFPWLLYELPSLLLNTRFCPCWTNFNILEETNKVRRLCHAGTLLLSSLHSLFACKTSLDNWKRNSHTWNCFIIHLWIVKRWNHQGPFLCLTIVFYIFLHLFLTFEKCSRIYYSPTNRDRNIKITLIQKADNGLLKEPEESNSVKRYEHNEGIPLHSLSLVLSRCSIHPHTLHC